MVGEQPVTTGGASAAECDICGHPVIEVHCKVRCLNCGYTRDCSDP